MRKQILLLFAITILGIGCSSQKVTLTVGMKPHKVYIVHGILGNKSEYIRMRKVLHENNFETVFFSYKSRKTSIPEASKELYDLIKIENPDSFSLVTHSLGGLIARGLLIYAEENPEFPKMKRVIMIAPPNQGTVVGNFMHKYSLFRWILGVNLRDVMNDDESLALKLPVKFEAQVGIIAGIREHESGYNPYIGRDNDGEISPEETKLGTENDFITVKASHISILRKKETIQQSVQFLKSGSFAH